jgi:hypothetical protein
LIELAPRLAQWIRPDRTLTWGHVLDAADWLRGEKRIKPARGGP